MPSEPMSFTEYQSAFAARIRDPRAAPRPPGAPDRRMRVYEELLYNNLEGFLLAGYPIARQLLGARAWKQTVRRFFAEHRCHSPLRLPAQTARRRNGRPTHGRDPRGIRRHRQ